jgi:hypothetical protein
MTTAKQTSDNLRVVHLIEQYNPETLTPFQHSIRSTRNIMFADSNASSKLVADMLHNYFIYSGLGVHDDFIEVDMEAILNELMDDATDARVGDYLRKYTELYHYTTDMDAFEAAMEDENQKVNASIGKN